MSATENTSMSEKITAEQVDLWVGSCMKRADIMELIAELANGDYPVEVFRGDVLDYEKEMQE
jgi:hypothetical protein